MSYTPVATNYAQPGDTVNISTAAAEFRTLKQYIQQTLVPLINASTNASSITTGTLTNIPIVYGTATAIGTILLDIVPTYTGNFTGTGEYISSYIYTTFNATTAATAAFLEALDVIANLGASSNENLTNSVAGLVGAKIATNIVAGATGTISNDVVLRLFAYNQSAAIVTNVKVLSVEQTQNSSTGSVVNNIGALLNVGTVGTTFNTDLFLGNSAYGAGNFALYSSNPALSYLSGALQIAGYFQFSGAHIDAGVAYYNENSGFSVTLGNNWHNIFDAAGALATGTIIMPASPTNGQLCKLVFGQNITTLTINGNGNNVADAPTSASAGNSFEFIYHSANTSWYRAQ